MKFLQPANNPLFSILLLALSLGWVFASALPASQPTGAITAPQTGFTAPDFTLNNQEGAPTRLADLRGKVVLLNIWASWCPPCRAEMPAMQSAYDDLAPQGLVILAVNSTAQDKPADVAAFVSEHNLTFPILLDLDGEVTRAYRVTSLPTSFFIGRDGKIREIIIGGPMAEALLRSRLQTLLNEAP